MAEKRFLDVSDLRVVFETDDGEVMAVDTIDLHVDEGTRFGLIGESGCGKTVFGHAIMRTLENTTIVTGNIDFSGRNLYSLDGESMRKIRGKGEERDEGRGKRGFGLFGGLGCWG